VTIDITKNPEFKDSHNLPGTNKRIVDKIHNYSNKSTFSSESEEQGTGHFRITGTPWDSIIKRDTVLVQCHASKPDSYSWCKYCREKGKVIRFQLFEAFKIVNMNSIFDWKKITLRKRWIAFDEDTWNIHRHDDTSTNQKIPSAHQSEEAATA
jgi:hypothetical protein